MHCFCLSTSSSFLLAAIYTKHKETKRKRDIFFAFFLLRVVSPLGEEHETKYLRKATTGRRSERE
jgi:hypothetical protein